jgi:hypothetical protein
MIFCCTSFLPPKKKSPAKTSLALPPSKSRLQATSGLEIQTRDNGLMGCQAAGRKNQRSSLGLSIFQVLVIDDLVNSLAAKYNMKIKAWWGHSF